MRRNTLKAAAVAALAGTLLQFGGCIGQLLMGGAIEVFAETLAGFVGNPADLFGGGQ